MKLRPGYLAKAAAGANQQLAMEKYAEDSFMKFAAWVDENPYRLADPRVHYLYTNPEVFKQAAVLPRMSKVFGTLKGTIGGLADDAVDWFSKKRDAGRGAVQKFKDWGSGQVEQVKREFQRGVGYSDEQANLLAARERRAKRLAGQPTDEAPGGFRKMERRVLEQERGFEPPKVERARTGPVGKGEDFDPSDPRHAARKKKKQRERKGSGGTRKPGTPGAAAAPDQAADINRAADIGGTDQTAGANAPAVGGAAPKGAKKGRNTDPKTIAQHYPGMGLEDIPFGQMTLSNIAAKFREKLPDDPVKAAAMALAVGTAIGLLEDDAIIK